MSERKTGTESKIGTLIGGGCRIKMQWAGFPSFVQCSSQYVPIRSCKAFEKLPRSQAKNTRGTARSRRGAGMGVSSPWKA